MNSNGADRERRRDKTPREKDVSTEKTDAIVLRVIDFSETSCVVTLFTRDFGKISALAKGARRPKGPFEAALDLLAVCRIVFIHKSTDALDLLTEAKLSRRFRSASKDLSRLYAAYYVSELLKELTEEADPQHDLYDVAEAAIRALDSGAAPARQVLRFEMATLRILGHMPQCNVCVECGKDVFAEAENNGGEKKRIAFGQVAGGVLCKRCRIGQRKVVLVTPNVVKSMRVFADAESDQWRDLNTDSQTMGELRGVLNYYFAALLGRRPRMQPYLNALYTAHG